MDRHEKKGNVIPLPDLENRLLQRGMDYFAEGKYGEAATMFSEAKSIGGDNPVLYHALLAAYLKQGNDLAAEKIAEEMLAKKIGDEETLDIYLFILLHRGEYGKLQKLTASLLADGEMRADRKERFLALQKACQELAQRQPLPEETVSLSKKNKNEKYQRPSYNKKKDGLKAESIFGENRVEAIRQIADIGEEELPQLLPEILSYLADPERDPFVKTVLLHKLYSLHYTGTVKVAKFGRKTGLDLSRYGPVDQVPFVRDVKGKIEERLEQSNPSLMEHALSLADRFFMAVYPLERDFRDAGIWCDAFIFTAESYLSSGLTGTGGTGDMPVPEDGDEEFRKAVEWILRAERCYV